MNIVASPYTKLFWNEYLINPQKNNYNIIFDQHITGNLDILRLINCLQIFIKNHILLNSHLQISNGDLCWEINSQIYNLFLFEGIEKQEKFVTEPFNLETGPLYRFGLFKSAKNRHDLILVFHHVIIDGNSFEQLISTISEYYNKNNKKTAINLDYQINNIRHTYNKLIQSVEDIHNSKMIKFWQQALHKCDSKVELPYHKTDQDDIGEYHFKLSKKLINQSKLSLMKTSLFCYFMSCYGYLLLRYTTNDNIHIAYPIGIREANDLSYGAQINTSILPITRNLNETVMTFIKKITQHIKNYNYSYLPIDKIVENSPIKHLNVAFAQTCLKMNPLNFIDCEVRVNNRYNINIANGELILKYQENSDDFQFICSYQKKLFSEKFIIQFCNHYQQLVQTTMLEFDYQKSLLHIPLLTKKEEQQILYAWNSTEKPYPKDKTISQLFEDQAKKNPDKIALVFKEQQLTYKELNEKSNQLARYIRNKYKEKSKEELTADTLIALYLSRSLEMIIGILAVLKSGGAYVPIDINYPQERVNYILEDINAKIILTQNHFQERNQENIYFLQDTDNSKEIDILTVKSNLGLPKELLILIDLSNNDIYKNDDHQAKLNLNLKTQADDLAYVIYTSGTTGKPKGVMIEHKGLHNLCLNQIKTFAINENSHVLQFASYVFDASVSEIFTTLMVSATLYITTEDERSDANVLTDYINKHKIDIATIPPILLNMLSYENLQILKTLVVAGDKCSEEIMQLHSKNKNLINAYGPTEATVCATMHEYKNGDSYTTIGKTLDNVKTYVLDQCQQPLPIGVVGELYIGGECLARGYLNKSELTNERFIVNPFQTNNEKENNKNGRIYKTGDLCKYLDNGNIEYIGRNDHQVKIRGYRIELGEIEQKLVKYPGIKQAVVLAKEDVSNEHLTMTRKYIVAYYVADKKINDSKILNYLYNQLSDYMIPQILVHIQELPLTINGKLDIKSLPSTDVRNKDNYVAPTTIIQNFLCDSLAKFLNIPVEYIGITDNFVTLGIDSILGIKFCSRIKESGYSCSYRDILECKTIINLSKHLEENKLLYPNHISNFINSKYIPLTPTQERRLIINKNIENDYYTSINQLSNQLDFKKFSNAWTNIIDNHIIFKLKINHLKNCLEITQSTPEVIAMSLENMEDLKNTYESWSKNNIIVYVKLKNSSEKFMILSLSHFFVDSVSMQILLSKLEQELEQQESSLPATFNYQEFILSKMSYLRTYNLDYEYYLQKYPVSIKNNMLHSQMTLFTKTIKLDLVNVAETQKILSILIYSITQAWFKANFNISHYFYFNLVYHGRFTNLKQVHTDDLGNFAAHYPILIHSEETVSSSTSSILDLIKNKIKTSEVEGELFEYLSFSQNIDINIRNKMQKIQPRVLVNFIYNNELLDNDSTEKVIKPVKNLKKFVNNNDEVAAYALSIKFVLNKDLLSIRYYYNSNDYSEEIILKMALYFEDVINIELNNVNNLHDTSLKYVKVDEKENPDITIY